jgi:hypothetical protein
MRPFAFVLVALASASAVTAQQVDTAKELQEIARRVDEQLRDIDKLLLDSSRKQPEGEKKPRELLQASQAQSQAAEQGIEDLIQKLTEMKNRSQSRSQDDQDQQDQKSDQNQQQDGQQRGRQRPQGRPQNRNENDTMPLQPQGQQQQQPQPQGQQQPQDQPKGKQPSGADANPDGGENKPGKNPPDQPTGPGQRGEGDNEWGQLQPYLNGLHNRGSLPTKPPEKFRHYFEAYLKSQQTKKD